jgi:hypothetical protein
MIGFITSSSMANMASISSTRVATETALKAVGRPSFILIDNDIDSRTKKYAATKELLYQITCLAVYMALVPPVFQKGAFKVAKKIFKNNPEYSKMFDKFKNSKEFLEYERLAKQSIQERKTSLSKDKVKKNLSEGLQTVLQNEESPKKYPIIKGAIELGTIIGSVLGLAILAPEVGHKTIHPIMKAMGMSNTPKTENNTELDTQA